MEESETCQKSKVVPIRSKTNGLKSEVFGEITFMDHCEIATPIGELTVLDGATTFLISLLVSSKSELESIKIFREYVDVADQTFMTLVCRSSSRVPVRTHRRDVEYPGEVK